MGPNQIGEEREDKGALENVHVLDIGSGLAGPIVATLLADFGAEVIKVKMQGVTPKLSLTRGRVRHPGRDMGEDTEEVLSQMLGYSHQEIEVLRAGNLSSVWMVD